MVQVVNVIPKDPNLQKVIEYYYFLSSSDKKSIKNFVHFPHYRTTLNIYFDAQVSIAPLQRTISHNLNNRHSVIFTNNKSSFKRATLHGAFNIIGVIFKPLGFNHFISQELFKLSTQEAFFFDDYLKEFNEDLSFLKNKSTIEEKSNLLDQIFKQKYREFSAPVITNLVYEIMSSKGTISVQELEKKLKTSRRTLLRHAQKHLNCSISNFKQIVKFRHTLDQYQKAFDKPSLTELSYNNDYYDQSDFINHFKSISGEKPSKLLSKLKQVDSRDMFWKFF